MRVAQPLLALCLLPACHMGYKSDTGSPAPPYTGDDEEEPPIEETGAPDDPDDEPEGDTGDTFDDTGAECDEETPVVRYLSPDDSNSMSSPVQVREAVLTGYLWGEVSVRKWEFLNYYTFPYEPAPAGDLSLSAALVEDPSLPDGFRLQVAVSSPQADPEHRPPMNLVFSLDTSGSMNGRSIELLKEVCLDVAHSLVEGDVVSVVTWDEDQVVLLESHTVSGPDDEVLVGAVAGLVADGRTNLTAGLEAAYDLAYANYAPDRVNRVILVSDGGANVGLTDQDLIGEYARDQDAEGIYLVGVGVGTMARYNDLLMDTVTDLGKGASVYIPSEEEAWALFVDRFQSTLGVAGRDVQVRLDLPPGFRIARFSGEEVSGDPREVEPQHIAPDDAMVFHQVLQTCAPQILEDQTPITVQVTWKDAVTFQDRSLDRTWTWGQLLAQDPSLLWKGAALLDYAEALSAWQRGDPTPMEEARLTLQTAREYGPTDGDLEEVAQVMEALQ